MLKPDMAVERQDRDEHRRDGKAAFNCNGDLIELLALLDDPPEGLLWDDGLHRLVAGIAVARRATAA